MITQGYLCDYTIHVPIFTNDPSNKKICEYLINNHRTIIVYCSDCKEGQTVCNIFNELQKGSAEYIDCHTNKTIRKEIIKKFKEGKLPFLVNVRVLTEGFDASITQRVCFMHMPSNKTTIIQIIGRALRPHPNKKYAKIILPYGIKEDEENINQFIKILAKNDSRIKKSFYEKKLGGYINIETIDDPNNENVIFKYEQIYSSFGQLLNGEDRWMKKLEQVKTYIDKYKKRPSSEDNDKNIKILGLWLLRQNKNYKNKTQIMKNQEIYNIWYEFINNSKYKTYFISNEKKWDNLLNDVINYMDKNNKRPSSRGKIKETKLLGSWLCHQTTNFKEKTQIIKNQNMYNKWNEFIDNPKYKKYFIYDEDDWNESLNDIIKYLDKNNKRPTDHAKNKETKLLGHWLNYQITCYNKKTFIMENQKIYDKFHDFITSIQYKKYFLNYVDKWDNSLCDVIKYINENNKNPSRSNKKKEIKILGQWLTDQKKKYKNRTYIMKNQKIYNKFHDFITSTQYKKYFKNMQNN